MTIAYISHPDCLLHDMGDGHPEQPARLRAIHARLEQSGLLARLQQHAAPLATDAQLRLAHPESYLRRLQASSPATGSYPLDADTRMNPHSLAAARRAAGAAVLGVDLLLGGEASAAFCAVRPPGHHAERQRAMGFCLFSSIAIAALYALEHRGLQRVAIVDFDVHHGNGTEDVVAGDERILFCSTFQHPLYPYSGTGPAAPNVINLPLPAGCDGAQFRAVVREQCLPRLRAFAPELVLVSAGFDAHRADPLAGMALVAEDFSWVTAQLAEQAALSAGGRVLSSLEGGYDLAALAESAQAHLEALLAADRSP
ncbi:MAG: histone deacetylase family protein [Haliea sp.]|uniref:histone deacetylase family protein n=1 Tax=Haliea sp. TaxID=1932666 RepID=UPI0032EB143F